MKKVTTMVTAFVLAAGLAGKVCAANNLTLTANPSTVVANGRSTSQLTVAMHVDPSTGTIPSSVTVRLALSNATGAYGYISPTDVSVPLDSNGNGSGTSTYTSGRNTGSVTVFASGLDNRVRLPPANTVITLKKHK